MDDIPLVRELRLVADEKGGNISRQKAVAAAEAGQAARQEAQAQDENRVERAVGQTELAQQPGRAVAEQEAESQTDAQLHHEEARSASDQCPVPHLTGLLQRNEFHQQDGQHHGDRVVADGLHFQHRAQILAQAELAVP